MPVFDFLQTTPVGHFSTFTTPGDSFTYTADNVNFTFSYVSGFGDFAVGYNDTRTGSATPHLIFFNSGTGPDVVRLQLAPTATVGPQVFSGTIASKVELQANSWFSQGSFKVQFTDSINNTGTVTVNGVNGNQLVTAVGSFTGIVFTSSAGNAIQTFLTLSVRSLACFTAGTGIATPSGPRAVEDLRPSDTVLTADGGTTTVRWLGEQPVATRYLHPAKINPICIKAGALADGVPSHDLWVSQDHAIALDGLLINAGALVNGETIYQVRYMPLDGFTYYHVETDAHELLLAEGVAAETFIDYAGRDGFVNGDERAGAPVIPEMALPRISAPRLVPQAIRDRLAARGMVRAA